MPVPQIPGGAFSGGAGGAAGPSENRSTAGFDNSGWNVNFGSGSIDGGMGKYLPWVIGAAGLFVVWRLSKSNR